MASGGRLAGFVRLWVGACFLLLTPGGLPRAALAHLFPPEVHLTLWRDGESAYIRLETSSGDYWRSAALRSMFDANQDGELALHEQQKLFSFLRRRALYGLTLRTPLGSEPQELSRRCTLADEVDTAMPVACEFLLRAGVSSRLPILRVENAKGEPVWVRAGKGPWQKVRRARNFWVPEALSAN